EAAGALYGAKLVKGMHRDAGVPAAGPAPALSLAPAGRVDLAAGVLRALSFLGPDARPMGRLVAVMGHGARVTNAPHASALQCGACGGHAGDVNARLLAGLMNDPSVRAGLEMRGIAIPADTVFVGGLHDTTADTVTLFEDTLPASHAADIARLRRALAAAGRLARAERGALLPRADKPETLLQRGGDWAELRPEWGLAGCAAFIAAPRARTAGRDLGGRAFLHSYEWRADDGFGVLELILTAPVVVASWISLQYYGSSVAPEAFGGGNKLLHNVVGGIGVLEGTAGTLRVGLPWQSVHDGETLRHEPVRLAVVVEAPVEAISAVLEKHPSVSALFDNGWLSLHAMDDSGRLAARYEAGTWVTRPGGAADRVSTAA
ncbi:MAG: putative inorganic carbon transporter subunit DabA, partial [Pseudomonadota bacterium]